nr:NTP transferase domain-containing protein [Aquabacterium fontiphilum]
MAGGEGRRMGGRDKGLVHFQSRPLVSWVLDAMLPQAGSAQIVANRHIDAYSDELRSACARHGRPAPAPSHVRADDPDLPARSGPLAGVLTALRHSASPWVWVNPCDTPALPAGLLHLMMQKALATDADVVLPVTGSPPQDARHHWLCALINTRVCPHTERVFANGERKIGQWVRSLRWETVALADDAGFININTLETPHGRD